MLLSNFFIKIAIYAAQSRCCIFFHKVQVPSILENNSTEQYTKSLITQDNKNYISNILKLIT